MVTFVRYELGLDRPEPTGDEAYGGAELPYQYAVEAWQEHRTHGTLPYVGGWLDQPPEVRRIFRNFNQLYWATRYHLEPESEHKRGQQGHSGDSSDVWPKMSE